MELTEQLILDRKHWITELRNPEIIKIEGELVSPVTPNAYCAMGVAGYVQDILMDGGMSALAIGKKFSLSTDVTDYIICMNDGSLTYKEKMVVGDDDDVFCQRKKIRSTFKPRSFEFIARWLEIYFALERMSLVSGDQEIS